MSRQGSCDTLIAMVLFLTAGIPAFLVLMGTLLFSGPFDTRTALGGAFRGALWFFPAILLYSFLAGLVSPAFDAWALYLSRTFLDLALPLVLALGVYLFSYRRELFLGGEDQFFRSLSFLSGFFWLFAVYASLKAPPWFSAYLYFLLPLLWMSLLSMAALSLAAFFSIVTGRRFFFPFGLAGALLLAGLVPFLYLGGHRPLAWILTLLIFSGGLPLLQRILSFLK